MTQNFQQMHIFEHQNKLCNQYTLFSPNTKKNTYKYHEHECPTLKHYFNSLLEENTSSPVVSFLSTLPTIIIVHCYFLIRVFISSLSWLSSQPSIPSWPDNFIQNIVWNDSNPPYLALEPLEPRMFFYNASGL